MKIFYFLIVLLLLTFSVSKTFAASPSPSDNSVEEQVSELKDKIASRVAELNLVEKRGIAGQVSDITGTQITLTDIRGDTRFIDVDELTKFEGKTSSFGFSDIKKDDNVSVLGLYNKQSKRILARTVEEITLPKLIDGFVATIDSDNFIVNVASENNEQFKVSVETTTKTLAFDSETKELIRSGFSKITEGESIFVAGKEDQTDKKLIDAGRIILLPQIVKTTGIEVPPSITPSTGSGKKLTPIVK